MHALNRVDIMTDPSDAGQNRPHLICPREAIEINELDLTEASLPCFQVSSQSKLNFVSLVSYSLGRSMRGVIQIPLE